VTTVLSSAIISALSGWITRAHARNWKRRMLCVMGTGLKSSVCGTTLMLQKSLFEENDITPPEEEDLR